MRNPNLASAAGIALCGLAITQPYPLTAMACWIPGAGLLVAAHAKRKGRDT